MEDREKHEREAADYTNAYSLDWLFKTDWNDPSPKDIHHIANALSERSDGFMSSLEDFGAAEDAEKLLRLLKFVREKSGSDEESIGIVARSRDFRDIRYENIANALKAMPIEEDDILAVEKRRVFSLVMATGGPSFEYEFIVDHEGDLVEANYVYKDWAFDKRVRIPENEAQAIWTQFESLALEETERSSPAPR